MSSRNLTEVFNIMRNNASKNRSLYAEDRKGSDDAELLLKRSICDMEEGIELRDEYGSQPTWMDKLEEAQYTMSKYVGRKCFTQIFIYSYMKHLVIGKNSSFRKKSNNASQQSE
uniref:Uncharacterized protein n=1 Tax=Glossina brevipalpis TaxID=37001 RepID=A0A1A9WIE2_9MUSC